ncbi:HD domain-containing protein [Alkalicoccus halolimnae]|uniref:HD domain-containing protein n=1 Tax=Alkalicoccus halolimnae TaxID=1667239 RepID=A0A5C7F892_9BACI|nr:HD domain-containing protein [Alkalicoccus halolimnae]TXF86902.1 HD domain-containing protein [Alkalicoccus halolimnae]
MKRPDGQLDEEKVFKDPVHRYIHVNDELIWELIGTREFQRLRRIRQLGTTYLTFHGAEHTRFNHSLGVYEIMRRMLENLEKKMTWDTDERLVCLAAALLHDVGHGPFSHSFEKVFQTDHEEWTRWIILGETEINAVLKRMGEDFPERVADVIAKTYENKLIVSLISSQIDADRMDYLLRDAFYTGVSYGQFDMERLLRVMRPQEDQAVFKHSGMHAVEDYIMSRYQMYWQVYFHPVTRSAEVILSKILHRAKELLAAGYEFRQTPHHFHSLFASTMTLQEYIRLDESIIFYYFQEWEQEEDPILSDLCQRFMDRHLFKYVECDPSKQMLIWPELQQLFTAIGLDPAYYLVIDSSSDLPYDFYRPGEKDERMPIHLQMPDGSLRELSRESDIVEAISGKKRTDHKLYFPEDLLLDQEEYGKEKRRILSLLHQQEG